VNLDIREMLGGDTARLRYIKRFSTCRTVSTETVAEHTAFVVIYSALIATWCRENNVEPEVDLGLLLRRAALHDIEESRTGDFPRTFKHRTPVLRDAVEHAAKVEALEVFKQLTDDEKVQDELFRAWAHAKDDTIEGKILEFSDFLSALAFVVEEKKVGNFCLSQHTGTFSKYLEKFTKTDYNFLRPLVRQAQQLVVEVLA
jgi:5'-deoxynucleotidase YfbR-like HD superfamily hydrolase